VGGAGVAVARAEEEKTAATVDETAVLDGIQWRVRVGARWRDVPPRYCRGLPSGRASSRADWERKRASARAATFAGHDDRLVACPVDTKQPAFERVGVGVMGAPGGVVDLVREPLMAGACLAPTTWPCLPGCTAGGGTCR
jgi:hypothetical protein